MERPYIYGGVYPDTPVPEEFKDEYDMADYVHRISTAFDWGTTPDFRVLTSFVGWKKIFDKYPVLGSIGYHTIRFLMGWDRLEDPSLDEAIPYYRILDEREGRTDPCENMI